MIQRKQTLFLLISLVLTVVCLCSSIGEYRSGGMSADLQVYNLWVDNGGRHDYSVLWLFLILLITCPITLKAIFSYTDRKLQSRLCLYNILLSLLWYAVFIVAFCVIGKESYNFSVGFGAILPLVSGILYFMARSSIIADEKLVRAADRIR